MTDAQIRHMVNRFLAWKLPQNFTPDCGISFKREFNENTPHPMKHEPSGTNLLDATQADAMVRHMLDGLPEGTVMNVDSASDDRTANNAVRHKYRVLSDEERAQMVAIKDKGAEFLSLVDALRTPLEPARTEHGDEIPGVSVGTFDRELNIAAERIEEAVMWAVKHITA